MNYVLSRGRKNPAASRTSSRTQTEISKEAVLIERFSSAYRKRLGQLVEQLNKPGFAAADMQCLRLCVEAVDLILSSQSQLARAIDRLSNPTVDAELTAWRE